MAISYALRLVGLIGVIAQIEMIRRFENIINNEATKDNFKKKI